MDTMPEHHKKIYDFYRERRDVMLECIEQYFPEGTKRAFPDGGFYTWVNLPVSLNTTELVAEAEQFNIAYLAGEAWFLNENGEGSNTARLSFSSTPPDKIREGVERLGKLFCSNMK